MKIKKVEYSYLLIICSICALGAVGYEFLQITRKSAADLPQKVLSSKEQILGTWVREDNASHKMVFGRDGKLQVYVSDVPELSGTFEITATCDGKQLPDTGLYLRITLPAENIKACQAINFINNKKLSLTPDGSTEQHVYLKRNPRQFTSD